MINRLRSGAAVALVLCLVLCLACAPPKREQLVKVAGYGQQLSALLQANWTLPDSLYSSGAITEARRDEVKLIFVNSRVSIDAFNFAMGRALAEVTPDYAALLPLVADLVEQVKRLNLGVKSDAYRRTLTAIEISLRGIASFFAVQIRQARAAGYTDRELGRLVDLRAVRVVELYAGENRRG